MSECFSAILALSNRAKSRSTHLYFAWTIPRPVSTYGSVQWSIMLSSGYVAPSRRDPPAQPSSAWAPASDIGTEAGIAVGLVLLKSFIAQKSHAAH